MLLQTLFKAIAGRLNYVEFEDARYYAYLDELHVCASRDVVGKLRALEPCCM